jgi:glucosamine--fructose-6-phosphate aminotransferase (isomerizing)
VTLPLAAGPELAIAATKTYTTQLAALALLAGAAAGEGRRVADALAETAGLLEGALPGLERRVSEIAVSLAFVGRMFAIGRGPEYATAREISLKLLETCRVAAEPLTATALAHGPIAALDGLFPVWAIASDDAVLDAVRDAAARAVATGALVLASGNAADRIDGAAHFLPVPAPPLPLLAPLLSVAPGQLVAWALAQAKGLDPDQPVGLTKITLAR